MSVSGKEIALTIALYCSLVFVALKLVAMAISGMAALIIRWIQ